MYSTVLICFLLLDSNGTDLVDVEDSARTVEKYQVDGYDKHLKWG